jgi:hypothetical protein
MHTQPVGRFTPGGRRHQANGRPPLRALAADAPNRPLGEPGGESDSVYGMVVEGGVSGDDDAGPGGGLLPASAEIVEVGKRTR